jgi:hypothetical protein
MHEFRIDYAFELYDSPFSMRWSRQKEAEEIGATTALISEADSQTRRRSLT